MCIFYYLMFLHHEMKADIFLDTNIVLYYQTDKRLFLQKNKFVLHFLDNASFSLSVQT